jgi:hypothetical protein
MTKVFRCFHQSLQKNENSPWPLLYIYSQLITLSFCTYVTYAVNKSSLNRTYHLRLYEQCLSTSIRFYADLPSKFTHDVLQLSVILPRASPSRRPDMKMVTRCVAWRCDFDRHFTRTADLVATASFPPH